MPIAGASEAKADFFPMTNDQMTNDRHLQFFRLKSQSSPRRYKLTNRLIAHGLHNQPGEAGSWRSKGGSRDGEAAI
jgi:hypothetical protein